MLLLLASVLFVGTALAYALVPSLEEKAIEAGQAPPQSAFRDALRTDGWRWLLYELGAMIVFGLLSMGLDRLRSLKQAEKEQQMREMPPTQRLFIDADALPFWTALWGAVSATALGAALLPIPVVLLVCAAIGAVSSGLVGVWIRLSMTNTVATSARHRTARAVITALLGAVTGIFALVFVVHEFLRALSFGE